MTRDELISQFVDRKAKKTKLTWGQFASAITTADQATKAAILSAANEGNGVQLFNILIPLIRSAKRNIAQAEVDAIAADDNLTIDELINILG